MAPFGDRAGSMTKNGHAGDGDVAEAVQRHRLVALVFAPEAAAAVGRVRLAQIDDAELLRSLATAGR